MIFFVSSFRRTKQIANKDTVSDILFSFFVALIRCLQRLALVFCLFYESFTCYRWILVFEVVWQFNFFKSIRSNHDGRQRLSAGRSGFLVSCQTSLRATERCFISRVLRFLCHFCSKFFMLMVSFARVNDCVAFCVFELRRDVNFYFGTNFSLKNQFH